MRPTNDRPDENDDFDPDDFVWSYAPVLQSGGVDTWVEHAVGDIANTVFYDDDMDGNLGLAVFGSINGN